MSREFEKEMKKVQTEIKMIDKMIHRTLWMKNILEDRLTAALVYSFIPLAYLLVYFLMEFRSSEQLPPVWKDPLFLSYVFLFLVFFLGSKRRLRGLDEYYRNLKCWRRYWVKERDDLLEEDPSLKDVKPGVHIREIAELSSTIIAGLIMVLMLWSDSVGSQDTVCCLTYLLFLTVIFIGAYFLPTMPYNGRRCPNT